MRDILVTAIIFGLIPFVLNSPAVGVLVWCWLGLMNPHRLCWGFALNFNFAQIIAVSALISLYNSKEIRVLPPGREIYIMFIFVIWMFITTLFAYNPEGAWMQWDKVWKIMLMTFVTIMVMQTPDRLHALVWIAALSIGFYGVKGGIFTLSTGGAHKVLGPERSFIAQRGAIALALNMTVPLMRYLHLQSKQIWVKLALAVSMVLTAFAIIGTHSRGGFLGAFGMAAFLILKSRRKILLFMVLVLTSYAVLNFMPAFWSERMHTIETYEQDSSAMGRINAWYFALNIAKDNPMGGGFECFRGWLFDRYAPEPNNVHDAHNIFFEVLGEHGFPGLFLFSSLIVFSWMTASRVIKLAKINSRTVWLADLASMVQVSLAAYIIGGSFLGLAYFDYFYYLVAMILLCKVLLEKYDSREISEEPEKDPLKLFSKIFLS